MKRTEYSSMLLLLLLTGCRGDPSPDPAGSGGGDDGGGEDSGGEVPYPPDESGTITLTDANNYTYTGQLDGPTLPMAELSDVTISWASLSADLQCHDLDPVADIDNTALLVFPYLTEEEVEDGLSTDTLQQVDVGVYLSQEPGDATSVQLADFTFFGTDADIEEEFTDDSGTWLVLLTTGTTLGVGSRMVAFLDPEPDETATTGEISDGCAVLDYTVDLQALSPIGVWTDGPWALDWTGVTATGQGGDFEPTKVTEVMVAWYEDIDISDLEGQFLDIELIADGMWTLDHSSGTTASLEDATSTVDDSVFPGFGTEGTWLLALRCGTCPNPAPLVLTQVIPVEGAPTSR